jgi:hypothetical protein
MTIFHKITHSAKLVILPIIPTYVKVSLGSFIFYKKKGEYMKQNCHMNANTNSHSRAIIHRAKASNTTLAHRFGVSQDDWQGLFFKWKCCTYGLNSPVKKRA